MHFYPLKSLLLILFCVLLASVTPLSCQAASSTLYVAIGDSITEGCGMSAKEDTFVAQLSQKLNTDHNNLNTYNLGKTGATITDTFQACQKANASNLLKRADYITITAGGNDVLALAAATLKEVTKEDYSKAQKIPSFVKSNRTAKLILTYLNSETAQKELLNFTKDFSYHLHRLLNDIRKINPTAKIALQTVYNPANGSEYTALSDCIDCVMLKINGIIKEEVAEREDDNLLLLDTYQLFAGQANTYVRILDDDIHPTKEGHTLIANCLYTLFTTGELSESTLSNGVSAQKSTELTPQQKEAGKTCFLTYSASAFIFTLFFLLLFKIRRDVI